MGNLPFEACSEEAISNSLDGINIVLNVIAKHITRNIVSKILDRTMKDYTDRTDDRPGSGTLICFF